MGNMLLQTVYIQRGSWMWVRRAVCVCGVAGDGGWVQIRNANKQLCNFLMKNDKSFEGAMGGNLFKASVPL